ncbi:MAG TPA: T9SS type A sorting domain-containing protein, partial [Flavobacterium sp.]
TLCVDTNNNGTGDVDVDTNDDGEIQQSEALAVIDLEISNSGITSLAGLEQFQNMESLDSSGNAFGTLDISAFTSLMQFICQDCSLTDINMQGLINLWTVILGNNLLTTVDFSNTGAVGMDLWNNPNLVYVNMKNGVVSGCPILLGLEYCTMFDGCPLLEVICVDEGELQIPFAQDILLTTYCSFVPGGDYNEILGTISVDNDSDGCDSGDLLIENIKITISDGTNTAYTFTNANGAYNFYAGIQNSTITAEVENDYYTISPPTQTLNFTTGGNTETANFCLIPLGTFNDVEIEIIPLSPARPGFDAHYKIIYRNRGTVAQSGSITLTFEDLLLDLISASQIPDASSGNILSWNYSDLQPLEVRSFIFIMNVNSPMETPAVNIGDQLDFDAVISGNATDETPENNEFSLKQIVVGSMDPNDKAVAEGDEIGIDHIGNYLHYVVRFQNTGNAPAEKVAIMDMLSNKLNPATLQITDASHLMRTELSGSKLEFFFDNINLPAVGDDEPGSHGYVTFKIRPKSNVVVDDVIENTAAIYFDFNFPIVTNTVSTTVTALGVHDSELSSSITIYPNPAGDYLKISNNSAEEITSVSVYNLFGQLIQKSHNISVENPIDISTFASGTYLVELHFRSNSKVTKKMIKL